MNDQNPFKPAKRSQSKLRLALMGAAGSGKSLTALKIAAGIGGKIAAIDTERGSLSKYAGDVCEFDVLELTDYHPANYIKAIQAAVANGYDVLLIDSLSHAWAGSGGILEQVDRAAKRSQSNNSFAAWRDVTPLHNQLIDTILGANVHIIVTLRSKTEYVLEPDPRGKMMPRKVGLAPVQREGLEFEMDIVAEMDMDNTLVVTKSRYSALSGAVVPKPNADLGKQLKAWLSDGVQQPASQLVEKVTNAETGMIAPPAPTVVEPRIPISIPPDHQSDPKTGKLPPDPITYVQIDETSSEVVTFDSDPATTDTTIADATFDRIRTGEPPAEQPSFVTEGVVINYNQKTHVRSYTFADKNGVNVVEYSREKLRGIVSEKTIDMLDKEIGLKSLDKPIRVHYQQDGNKYKAVRIEAA